MMLDPSQLPVAPDDPALQQHVYTLPLPLADVHVGLATFLLVIALALAILCLLPPDKGDKQ